MTERARPSLSDLRVEPATDADLPAMRRIAAESFDRERMDPAGVVDLLHARPRGPSVCLAAHADGSLIGFCYASTCAGAGYVDALAVTTAARRHRVGSALLDEMCTRLADAGC